MDKELWRRVGVRVALVVSLFAAAIGGAVIAMQLRPSGHASAALRQATPGHAAATAAPRPTATASATAVPVLTVVPERAMLAVDNGPAVSYGSWIRSLSPTLRVTLPSSRAAAPVQVEVEVAPAGHPFDGSVSVKSAPLTLSQTAPTTVTVALSGLNDGLLYHWHVRTTDERGVASAWVGGGLFGVSVSAPAVPKLAATNADLGTWSQSHSALFRWIDAGSRVPVAYYQYALARGAPPPTDQLKWHHARGSVLSLSGLAQGYWRVFVRAVDMAGNTSAPVKWGFGVAVKGPPAPRIVGSDPAEGLRTAIVAPSMRWLGVRGAAPVASYEYTVVPGSGSAAGAVWVLTNQDSISLPGLTDGVWAVYVRSVDVAGNRSSAVRWSFAVDRTAPSISALALSAGSFTPPMDKLRVSYTLTKTAVVSYTIALSGTDAPIAAGSLGLQIAGKHVAFSWNGMLGRKRMAPGGQYTFSLEAVDAAGNHSKVLQAHATLLDKRIVISISKEELWAYQGNTLIVHTLVTNGGPDTPTIPGIFHILGKYPDWVFHSPWPKGSPLWYPDSPTSFALLYQQEGGYFLHDAPWRSNYGPGSNSLAGTPGGSYTGTHGCTNVPYDAMKLLYDWADVGTAVQIVK